MVSQAEWQAERDKLLVKEKELTRDEMLDNITLYWLTGTKAAMRRALTRRWSGYAGMISIRGECMRHSRDQRVHWNPASLVTPTV
jgi:hypothetical protein